MSKREIALAVLLAAAAGLVVAGVARVSEAAGYITAGVLVAALAFLFLTEVGR